MGHGERAGFGIAPRPRDSVNFPHSIASTAVSLGLPPVQGILNSRAWNGRAASCLGLPPVQGILNYDQTIGRALRDSLGLPPVQGILNCGIFATNAGSGELRFGIAPRPRDSKLRPSLAVGLGLPPSKGFLNLARRWSRFAFGIAPRPRDSKLRAQRGHTQIVDIVWDCPRPRDSKPGIVG